MNLLQAIFLGLVQGLTEFLPVSSSGHLAILQKQFGLSEGMVSFDIILHLGTLIAILIFFRIKLWKLIKKTVICIDFHFRGNDTKNLNSTLLRGSTIKKSEVNKFPREIWLILIGSIPAILVGFLLKDIIDDFFSNIKLIGFNLVITGLFLFLASKIKEFKFDLQNISFKKIIFIGIFQALAILPGVSRSAATTSSASFLGLKREDGFYFSFLLAIPAILGAVILDLPSLIEIESKQLGNYFSGFLVAFISGFLALRIFEIIFVKNKLIFFSIYCFLLGILTIFVI